MHSLQSLDACETGFDLSILAYPHQNIVIPKKETVRFNILPKNNTLLHSLQEKLQKTHLLNQVWVFPSTKMMNTHSC